MRYIATFSHDVDKQHAHAMTVIHRHMLHVAMLHATCYMLHATCYMLHATCYMLHATHP
jgi:hypothetical protein